MHQKPSTRHIERVCLSVVRTESQGRTSRARQVSFAKFLESTVNAVRVSQYGKLRLEGDNRPFLDVYLAAVNYSGDENVRLFGIVTRPISRRRVSFNGVKNPTEGLAEVKIGFTSDLDSGDPPRTLLLHVELEYTQRPGVVYDGLSSVKTTLDFPARFVIGFLHFDISFRSRITVALLDSDRTDLIPMLELAAEALVQRKMRVTSTRAIIPALTPFDPMYK